MPVLGSLHAWLCPQAGQSNHECVRHIASSKLVCA
jgi:hypothetical protein